MNDFKKRIQITNNTQEIIHSVENYYSSKGQEMSFKDKIALAVYDAILSVETQNQEEEQIKKYMLNTVNKYVSNLELEK